ncbi:CRE-SSR-2 protein [Caenorhabditis remanei]|uniref:CRE-SSR-2 protein n=1 Tax=Caenorhabditis remanei TaxID=31234 RepID=E3M2C6_CAERE|nr:CRE-SSR-2 protein [Caenorhabditis remanei]
MCEERYRLVVLGSAKVGKTNIIRRYLYNEFSSKYKETIEDLHSREFRIQGVPLPLDILDTNFNFPDMRRLSITSASAFLLVFSVDDVTSFKEARHLNTMSDIWQEICSRRSDLNELPIVVVGNKCDVENKKIYEETAKAFTSRLSSDVRYIEVSAKDNIRITDVFRTLLELSGFPRCKAGGGRLDDVVEDEETRSSSSIRRSATVRAKSTTKRDPRRALMDDENKSTPKNGSQSPREQPQLDKQASHPVLAVPLHIGDLKRNLSLRMRSPRRDKEQVERKLSDEPKISRSSSLIRRTKHLSLKMRRHGEKSNHEEVVDESDCKIQ